MEKADESSGWPVFCGHWLKLWMVQAKLNLWASIRVWHQRLATVEPLSSGWNWNWAAEEELSLAREAVARQTVLGGRLAVELERTMVSDLDIRDAIFCGGACQQGN